MQMKVLVGEERDSAVPETALWDHSVISAGTVEQTMIYYVRYQGIRYTFIYLTYRANDSSRMISSFKDNQNKTILVWLAPGESGTGLSVSRPDVPLLPRIQITGPFRDTCGRVSGSGLAILFFTGQGQPPWPIPNLQVYRGELAVDAADRILLRFRCSLEDGGFVASSFCTHQQVPLRTAIVEALRVALQNYDPTFPVKWP